MAGLFFHEPIYNLCNWKLLTFVHEPWNSLGEESNEGLHHGNLGRLGSIGLVRHLEKLSIGGIFAMGEVTSPVSLRQRIQWCYIPLAHEQTAAKGYHHRTEMIKKICHIPVHTKKGKVETTHRPSTRSDHHPKKRVVTLRTELVTTVKLLS